MPGPFTFNLKEAVHFKHPLPLQEHSLRDLKVFVAFIGTKPSL